MRKRLTDLAVERLGKPGEIWDTVQASFGIRIGARVKVWQIVQRKPGKKHPTRIKVGTFPAMKVAEARAKAGAMLAGDGAARAAPLLFSELIDPFLDHGRTRSGRPIRPATEKAYRSILNGTAKPLHSKAIAEIRRRDIAALLADVDRRTGPSNAALTRATLSRFWSWMLETDQADASPVTGSPSYAIPKSERVLSDAEIGTIWTVTDRGGQNDRPGDQVADFRPPGDFGMILRLLLWTGARRSEVGGMAWSEICSRLHVWTIPAARVKTHRALALPLPRQALAAIAAWPVIVGHDRLFGRGPGGFANWTSAKAALDKRLRFNRPWQIRDIRRTVETRLAELGVLKEIRSRILNHDVGEIEGRYNIHGYLAEKRAALQLWANEIERIVK